MDIYDFAMQFEDQVYVATEPLSGLHRLRVEYAEYIASARIRFWWTRMSDLPTPTETPTSTPSPTVESVPEVQFGDSEYVVSEATAETAITVTLSSASDHVITVDYVVDDGWVGFGRAGLYPEEGRADL